MDSDDSRPGSSASNSSGESSANSDDNSRQSSPAPPDSPQQSSPSSGGGRQRKSRSRSTRSKSQSQTSESSTSENEDENDHHDGNNSQQQAYLLEQQQEQQQQLQQHHDQKQIALNDKHDNDMENHSNSSRSSSSGGSSRESSPQSFSNRKEGVISRNQSMSPARKSRSSSASSVGSQNNESRKSVGSAHSGRSGGIDDKNAMPNIGTPESMNGGIDENHERVESALNISHEDFSDVSDIEGDDDGDENAQSSRSLAQNDEDTSRPIEKSPAIRKNSINDIGESEPIIIDLRQKLDQKKNQKAAAMEDRAANENNGSGMKTNGSVSEALDDLVKRHDEDALDFEAEEGECQELTKEEEQQLENEKAKAASKEKSDKKDTSDKEVEEGEELEEGEVTDEDEKRPEETEPKPICRFYTRGQCTWGMSCRFLHPGVTDKGNYTMFDMVRPVPVPPHGPPGFGGHPFHDFRTERPPLLHRPPIHGHHPHLPPHYDARVIPPVVDAPVPVIESAWERGLRTAKEMVKKANRRKEQDMDFEDKKMNLTISQEELEKDNYYIRGRESPDASPPPVPYTAGRHPPESFDTRAYSPPPRRGPPAAYDEEIYNRSARYRELPPHRMPQYEDERRVRPAREVIVQRVEPAGRADEWNDPWMRSKSPGSRRDRERVSGVEKRTRRDRRSYSSNSSYSSSSASSQSGSSSESSRSASPDIRRNRYNSNRSGSHHNKSPPPSYRRHIKSGLRSPSSPPRRRRSPSVRRSPPIRKRHFSPSRSPISPPPKRIPISPPIRRKKISTPPPRKDLYEKTRKQRRRGETSSSGSDSSDSSGSESGSSYSTSSGSSSRGKTPVKRPPPRKLDEKTSISERKTARKEPPPLPPAQPKKRSPISIEIKKPTTIGQSALNSESINSPTSTTPTTEMNSSSRGKTVRREELLRQLRAVEDAIARKKQKLK